MRDSAVIGGELVGGVLGGHAALKGVAAHADRFLVGQGDLGVGKWNALRDEDLALDQVDTGDDFRHGVFHLDTRIDLDEVEPSGFHVDKKFDGPGVVVLHVLTDLDRRVADIGAQLRIEIVGGGDFDDLLMAALNRAIAFVKVNEVAVTVAQELHFDVLRLADELFEEDVGNAEGRSRLAPCLIDGGVEPGRGFDDAHAATAASH